MLAGKGRICSAAARRLVSEALPDIIEEHLEVLFCGVNPGLEAAATGRHFAGRGNRFWRVIHIAGFTPKELRPQDGRGLLAHGCGLTAFVERPTARADELSPLEFAAAAAAFERKVSFYAPRFVAFLGKAAYAALSGQRDVVWGLQTTTLAASAIWVLPNPSGRNRAFTQARLVAAYAELHSAAFSKLSLA
jgi:TDG/mug DNA glycosylase family protein